MYALEKQFNGRVDINSGPKDFGSIGTLTAFRGIKYLCKSWRLVLYNQIGHTNLYGNSHMMPKA